MPVGEGDDLDFLGLGCPGAIPVEVHRMYPPSSICTPQHSFFVILRIVAVVIKDKRLRFPKGSKHSTIYKVIENLT